VTTVHDFGGVLGLPLDTFFGISQFHGHGSWLVCEVALNVEEETKVTWVNLIVYAKWLHLWPKIPGIPLGQDSDFQ
jgi:hypothetical protein